VQDDEPAALYEPAPHWLHWPLEREYPPKQDDAVQDVDVVVRGVIALAPALIGQVH